MFTFSFQGVLPPWKTPGRPAPSLDFAFPLVGNVLGMDRDLAVLEGAREPRLFDAETVWLAGMRQGTWQLVAQALVRRTRTTCAVRTSSETLDDAEHKSVCSPEDRDRCGWLAQSICWRARAISAARGLPETIRGWREPAPGSREPICEQCSAQACLWQARCCLDTANTRVSA